MIEIDVAYFFVMGMESIVVVVVVVVVVVLKCPFEGCVNM